MAARANVLRPQPWEWPRPRVLLELLNREESSARIQALRRAGYAVAVCPGSTAEGRCSLAGDEDCAVAHGADIVVSSLGLDSAQAREPLAALRRRLPDLPVLVEADAETAARWSELVRAEERLEPGAEPSKLVHRVRRALGEESPVRA